MNRFSSGVFATSLLVSLHLLSGCSAPVDPGCTSDAQCRQGRVCVDGKCQWTGEPPNGLPNNVSSNNANVDPNNADDSNDVNGATNSDTSGPVNNMVDPDVLLCQDFCDMLFGSCVDRACAVSEDQRRFLDEATEACLYEGLEEGDPGCVEAVRQDPEAREDVEDVVEGLSCDSEELVEFRCEELRLGDACGCEPAGDLGSSCEDNADCAGTDLENFCVDEENEPPFPGGYCSAAGCELDPRRPRPEFDDDCGEGNVCLPAGEGEPTGICLDGCTAHDECRPGYQCRLVGAEFDGFGEAPEPIRVCLAECSDDLRCRNPAERCNDGRCEFPCTDDSNMGPSGRMRCNALGFACEADSSGQEWCVMP
jgi:hypothetical protein